MANFSFKAAAFTVNDACSISEFILTEEDGDSTRPLCDLGLLGHLVVNFDDVDLPILSRVRVRAILSLSSLLNSFNDVFHPFFRRNCSLIYF